MPESTYLHNGQVYSPHGGRCVGPPPPIKDEGDPMTIWVNATRTVMVRRWPDGTMEVATRPHESGIWGPPTVVREEAAVHA